MTRRAVQPALPLSVPPMPPAIQAELSIQTEPGWAGKAACASRSVDPDWRFARADDELHTAARGVCETCPVRRSCLAHALATSEPYGIWGGFDEVERIWLRLALAEGTRVSAALDLATRTAAA